VSSNLLEDRGKVTFLLMKAPVYLLLMFQKQPNFRSRTLWWQLMLLVSLGTKY